MEYNEKATQHLSEHFEQVIKHVGEDVEREGLLKTPERAAKAMQFLTHGYDLNPDDLVYQAIFHEEYSEMVIVKDIDPHPEMEYMAMRTSKERYIILISSGQQRICCGCRIFMDAFLAESYPNLTFSNFFDAFNLFTFCLYHNFKLSYVMILPSS